MNDLFELLTAAQKKLLSTAPPDHLRGIPAGEWPAEDFLHTLCDALNIPAFAISPENVDLDAYDRYQHTCAQFQFLPLFESDVLLQVASVQPWNEPRLMELRGLLEKEIRPVGITEENLEQTMATMEGRLALREKDSPEAPAPRVVPPLLFWPIDHADRQH